MFFNSYLVFIYVILFVLIYDLSKVFIKNRIVNNLIIITANVFILLTVVKEHSLIVISILGVLVFLSGKVLQKKSVKSLLLFSLFFIAILFSIRNYNSIQEIISNSFIEFLNAPVLSVQKVGLSYILFRFIHWLVESYKKSIHQSDFLTFLNYIFFFPSFLAGPIDTYNNFHYWLGKINVKYQKKLFFAGVSRIFIGSVKTLLIVPQIAQYAIDYKELIPYFDPLAAIVISLVCYSVYIYFDFSGYSDIAIGTAYLIGIKSPENFNNPYFSHNLSDFWKRWHITFSTFLMQYVFKPFIGLYNKIISPRYKLVVSILGYLTAFLICGIWHGNTINFVYWGLWHGLGLSLNKIWSVKITPHFSFYNSKAYNYLCVFSTFLFVTIGWLFFHYSTNQLTDILFLIF